LQSYEGVGIIIIGYTAISNLVGYLSDTNLPAGFAQPSKVVPITPAMACFQELGQTPSMEHSIQVS